MNNIDKVLDRVRKLLSLAENTSSEAEAAQAASQAAALMEEYELTEALVRLEEPAHRAEPIVKEMLEPDVNEYATKRVAWKETIAQAVANDLGVHMFYWHRKLNGRNRTTVRGMGRQSAIQAWRYTCQYLWNTVNELAESAWQDRQSREDDQAWEEFGGPSARAWKNAFRVGAASRIAVRLAEARKDKERVRDQQKAEIVEGLTGTALQRSLAMTAVEKDREEVSKAYKEMAKGWGTSKSIGQVTSADGYRAGERAADDVSLGSARAGLAAGE